MKDKIYRFYGIDTAMDMLRPGARWEIENTKFTLWEDERPCPTIEEVFETMNKIKQFEDSINTLYTNLQLEELKNHDNLIQKTLSN